MKKKKKGAGKPAPGQKNKPKHPRLLPTLKYLNYAYIAAAVLEVFRYNQKVAEPVQKFEASADVWAIHSDLRRDIYTRAKEAWCRLAKKDFTWFPYSEDYVAKLYMRFRKRNPSQLRAWEKELGEALLYAATTP